MTDEQGTTDAGTEPPDGEDQKPVDQGDGAGAAADPPDGDAGDDDTA